MLGSMFSSTRMRGLNKEARKRAKLMHDEQTQVSRWSHSFIGESCSASSSSSSECSSTWSEIHWKTSSLCSAIISLKTVRGDCRSVPYRLDGLRSGSHSPCVCETNTSEFYI